MMCQPYLFPSLKVEPLRSQLSSGSTIIVLDAYQFFIDQIISLSINSCDVGNDVLVSTGLMIVLYSEFGTVETETASSYM